MNDRSRMMLYALTAVACVMWIWQSVKEVNGRWHDDQHLKHHLFWYALASRPSTARPTR